MSDLDDRPQQLHQLLHDCDGTLASIAQKTNSISILSDIVQKICPDLPENAWRLANFQQKSLVIEACSPAWGQRLQFERNKISRELKSQTHGIIEKIDIKVMPQGRAKSPQAERQEQLQKQKSSAEQRYLSKSTASNLQSLAENAPKGLKEKLEKLASHVKN